MISIAPRHLVFIFSGILISGCSSYKHHIKGQLNAISDCFEQNNPKALTNYMDTEIADYFINTTDSLRKYADDYALKFDAKNWKIKGDSEVVKVYKGSPKGTTGYNGYGYFENQSGEWKLVCYFIYGEGVIGSCFGSKHTNTLDELIKKK